ncbi:MAG: PilZ domain-containing protein [Gammaproteobacteria bacterium]|nr:PilZ domain-containing protein [Gammaproteobacteria bacterium]
MKTPSSHSILSVHMPTDDVLHAAYMPFIKRGAIFVPSEASHGLGDEVLVMLQLPDDAAPFPVAGTVVWITPPGTGDGRAAGVGVQFDARDDNARRRIEARLARFAGSDRPTQTL